MFPFLYKREIADEFSKENFLRIQDFFNSDVLNRCEFQFFEFEIAQQVTGQKIAHRLKFTPKDVLVLHNSNNVGLTWNWSEFDDKNVSLTTTGATTIRVLIGRYANG